MNISNPRRESEKQPHYFAECNSSLGGYLWWGDAQAPPGEDHGH